MSFSPLRSWIKQVFSQRPRGQRNARPQLQLLEDRTAPATLPITFEVPALVAAKGVYVGVFGQLENGTTGYTSVTPYTPAVGPSTGQQLNGNNWVYLTSGASGSTTLGPSTNPTAQVLPTATAVTVNSVAGFPTGGATVLLQEPGLSATASYTSVDTATNTLLGFQFLTNPAAFAATATISLQSVSVAGTTLPVGSTTGFPTSGKIFIETANGNTELTYTGTTATSFTGVTGGTGSLPGGSLIVPAPVVASTTLQSAVSPGGGTLTVAANGTAGFPSAGSLLLTNGATTQIVSYTGITSNSFTGVSGLTNSFPINTAITSAMDYALAPAGDNLPLMNLFPNPASLPTTNAIVTATIYVPDFLVAPITSGQIVISVGSAMAIPVATAGTIASPGVASNPNDIFGLFEWGWDTQAGNNMNGVLDIDISEVDQAGFPFQASTTPAMPAPAQDGTGMKQTRDVLFSGFAKYINGLDPASNAGLFLKGDPYNTQTTFPIGTRITAPQDIIGGLEAAGPSLAGQISSAAGSLPIDPTGDSGFYYVVTAVSATGESMAGNLVRVKPFTGSSGGSNVPYQSAALSWDAYPYATGYKVYRGATSGFNNANGQFVNGPLSLMTLTTLPATTLTYTDGAATPPTPQPANNQPPGNNYTYDLLNQYFTTELQSFFSHYTNNDFVIDHAATHTTWKGRVSPLTVGSNTYTVLQLTGQAGPYGGDYAGYTANIYLPMFNSNTDNSSLPAAPIWLTNPTASPASMVFGCDGVFDQPDNSNLPSTTLAASSLTLGGTTINVASTAGFASVGTLVITGPGNTNQTVTYTGLTSTSFTGVSGGSGTFTSASVFGTSATASLAGSSLVLPNPTIVVNSTTGFPVSGSLTIDQSGNPASPQTVTYASTNAANFLNVTGGTGTFTVGTSTVTSNFGQPSFSSAPTTIVKDIMNSIASAFNRGIATQFTLPPSYWAANPSPLTGAASTASGSTTTTAAAVLTTTIPVVSTAGFATSGTLTISNGTDTETVSYTSTTGTAFLGVTGLGQTFTTGATIVQSANNTTTSAAAIPGGTLTVGSTAGFATTGTAVISNGPSNQTFTYTGLTGTTFTGVTGLTSQFASGSTIAQTGTLSGTYYYAITAVNVNDDTSGNETTPSNVVKVAVTSPNQAVDLAWAPLNTPGGTVLSESARSFNIYRGTSPDNLKLIANVANTNLSPLAGFRDVGLAAGTASPSVMYYPKGSTANFYAAYFHKFDVSINGLAYGFPYDDQGGFSTNVQMQTPNQVNISLLPWTASTQLVVTAPTTAIAGKSNSLVVTAKDASGAVDTTFAGTVTFTSSDPLATLPASYTFQPSDQGTKTFSFTLGTGGAQTVTVTDAANNLEQISSINVASASPDIYVERLYQDLLGRNGDPAGAAYWSAALNAGLSPRDLVLAFQNSVEYRTDQIDDLYSQLLHRTADSFGKSTFLALNWTPDRIRVSIFGSQEYFQTRGGSTVNGFLVALYNDQLGRSADAAGLQFWTKTVGATSRLDVASSFVFSFESSLNRVGDLYTVYLLRSADSAGLAHWTSLLLEYDSMTNVLADILSSPEFMS